MIANVRTSCLCYRNVFWSARACTCYCPFERTRQFIINLHHQRGTTAFTTLPALQLPSFSSHSSGPWSDPVGSHFTWGGPIHPGPSNELQKYMQWTSKVHENGMLPKASNMATAIFISSPCFVDVRRSLQFDVAHASNMFGRPSEHVQCEIIRRGQSFKSSIRSSVSFLILALTQIGVNLNSMLLERTLFDEFLAPQTRSLCKHPQGEPFMETEYFFGINRLWDAVRYFYKSPTKIATNFQATGSQNSQSSVLFRQDSWKTLWFHLPTVCCPTPTGHPCSPPVPAGSGGNISAPSLRANPLRWGRTLPARCGGSAPTDLKASRNSLQKRPKIETKAHIISEKNKTYVDYVRSFKHI